MWSERKQLILLLAAAIISQAISNMLLSQGMKLIAGEHPEHYETILMQAVRSPLIWLGVGFVVIFFTLFAAALSRADLSYVLPAISSEVVINVASANYFLGETVSTTRWIGAVLISIGVVLVVRSSPRTFGIGNERNALNAPMEEAGR